MKTNKTGPGRPKYVPVVPKGKFTMNEFCEANGVNLKTGKGKLCSKLTLIKFLARDKARRNKSEVVQLKGEFSQPNSDNGLGRKAFVFVRRSVYEALKARKVAKAAMTDAAPKVSAPKTTKPKPKMDTGTSDYEAQKTAILAPVMEVPATAVEPAAEPETVLEPVTA